MLRCVVAVAAASGSMGSVGAGKLPAKAAAGEAAPIGNGPIEWLCASYVAGATLSTRTCVDAALTDGSVDAGGREGADAMGKLPCCSFFCSHGTRATTDPHRNVSKYDKTDRNRVVSLGRISKKEISQATTLASYAAISVLLLLLLVWRRAVRGAEVAINVGFFPTKSNIGR